MGRRKWGAVFLAAILLASFYVAATKSHVNATPLSSVVPPEGSIIVPDDYPTIQEAVDNAPEGGTIFVRNGVYYEKVLVEKPLSLIGEDRENTIIYVPHLGGLLTYAAIEVQADDVTIWGFTIQNAPVGILITHYPKPYPSRCKIIDDNIVDNFRYGILMYGENHMVSGNNIKAGRGHGVSVESANSDVSGNNITGNNDTGITVSSSNVTISGNNITGNYDYIGESHLNTGGISLGEGGPYYVYGNNITDNQRYGIAVTIRCNNASIYQNNITHNTIGIELKNLALNESLTIGAGNTIYKNNLIDNAQQVVINKKWEYDVGNYLPPYGNGTAVVLWDKGKEGNYWNNYNGTDNDGDGIGDTPYVIDENNADHYPLMNPVAISSTPPTSNTSDSPLTIAAFVVVAVTVFVVVFFVYRAHRKREAD